MRFARFFEFFDDAFDWLLGRARSPPSVVAATSVVTVRVEVSSVATTTATGTSEVTVATAGASEVATGATATSTTTTSHAHQSTAQPSVLDGAVVVLVEGATLVVTPTQGARLQVTLTVEA